MRVSEWMELHPNTLGTALPDWSLRTIVEHMLATPGLRDIYVVATDGRLIGHIGYHKLARLLLAEHNPEHTRRQLMHHIASATAEEIMDSHFVTAAPDDELEDILHRQLSQYIDDMPVVDINGKAVGVIKLHDVLGFFCSDMRKHDQGG